MSLSRPGRVSTVGNRLDRRVADVETREAALEGRTTNVEANQLLFGPDETGIVTAGVTQGQIERGGELDAAITVRDGLRRMMDLSQVATSDSLETVTYGVYVGGDNPFTVEPSVAGPLRFAFSSQCTTIEEGISLSFQAVEPGRAVTFTQNNMTALDLATTQPAPLPFAFSTTLFVKSVLPNRTFTVRTAEGNEIETAANILYGGFVDMSFQSPTGTNATFLYVLEGGAEFTNRLVAHASEAGESARKRFDATEVQVLCRAPDPASGAKVYLLPPKSRTQLTAPERLRIPSLGLEMANGTHYTVGGTILVNGIPYTEFNVITSSDLIVSFHYG